MHAFEQQHTEVIEELNRYVREHPTITAHIPDEAIVILQLAGDEAFNAWARQLEENRRSEGHPLVFVKIKPLKPLRSRIARLELQRVTPTGA